MSSSRLYLGHLPRVDERDVEHFFKGYGRIVDIKLMTGFGFVDFEDYRDARDAVAELNGKTMLGERIGVEFAKGGRDRRDDRGFGDQGGRFDDRRPFERREPRFARPRRTGYRAIVENLHPSTSWQDLKDFARTAGEVTFADCHKEAEGVGAIEYELEADLANAVEKLNGQDLKGNAVTLRADPNAAPPVDDFKPAYARRDRSRSPVGRRRSPSPRPRSMSPYDRRGGGGSMDRRRSPSPYARRRSRDDRGRDDRVRDDRVRDDRSPPRRRDY